MSQAEQLEANRKRMQKYEDDAENDYDQIAALAAALQHYKKLSHDSEALYLEKERLAQQLKELQFERDHLSLQLDGAVASDVHDALQLAHDQLQARLQKLEKENENMLRKISTLEAVNAKLKEKLEALTGEVNDLRRTGTPRPNSDPIFEVLGTTREEALNIGEEDRATTVGTFEFLLSQTVQLEQRIRQLESLAPNDDPYFVGLGTGDEVLPSLRVEKGRRIRNRRMVKRDVEHFVDKLFKRKGVDDKFRGEKKLEAQTFQEFFHAELTRMQIHQVSPPHP